MTTEPSFKEKFSAEAIEHIAEVTAALMALERGDVDARLHIERSLRAAHSIKGGAGLVGLRTLESVAHAVETVIEDLRDGRLALTPSTTDRLLAAVDRMGAMVNDLDHSDQADVAGILAALLELSAQATHSDEPAKVHPPSTGSIELAVDAQAREFAISERIRSVVPPVGESLYGVKLDFFACERLRGLDAIQVALRLEQAGTIIDARCDLPGPSLRDGTIFSQSAMKHWNNTIYFNFCLKVI